MLKLTVLLNNSLNVWVPHWSGKLEVKTEAAGFKIWRIFKEKGPIRRQEVSSCL